MEKFPWNNTAELFSGFDFLPTLKVNYVYIPQEDAINEQF